MLQAEKNIQSGSLTPLPCSDKSQIVSHLNQFELGGLLHRSKPRKRKEIVPTTYHNHRRQFMIDVTCVIGVVADVAVVAFTVDGAHHHQV